MPQVAIHPTTTTPAAWERFAIRVVNPSDTPIVALRVDVPLAVMVLGVEPHPDWTFQLHPASDTTPPGLAWSGHALQRGEFREFAFLGRVIGDARRQDLVFPVRVTRADGESLEWSGPVGSRRAAPRVAIAGRAQLSVRGAVALSGVGIALGAVALGVALSRRARGPG